MSRAFAAFWTSLAGRIIGEEGQMASRLPRFRVNKQKSLPRRDEKAAHQDIPLHRLDR